MRVRTVLSGVASVLRGTPTPNIGLLGSIIKGAGGGQANGVDQVRHKLDFTIKFNDSQVWIECFHENPTWLDPKILPPSLVRLSIFKYLKYMLDFDPSILHVRWGSFQDLHEGEVVDPYKHLDKLCHLVPWNTGGLSFRQASFTQNWVCVPAKTVGGRNHKPKNVTALKGLFSIGGHLSIHLSLTSAPPQAELCTLM